MRSTITFLAIFLSFFSFSFSQTTISGVVTDTRGNAIAGANVFIEGTYDGTTTVDDGSFSFSTAAAGKQVLLVSFLSYQSFRKEATVEQFLNLKIILREDVNSLDAVVISAGTFEAGEKARVSVLKPLDIVTTAGSVGDIVAALQTLPGTQTVGESGRLFVRGGEAGETQTFVDGLRVAQPYGASIQNVPARGRFSPFLFSGISFSTGGYGAEYGEALSSVLLLNTEDLPAQTETDISLMTVGLGLGHTQKWQKSSLTFNSSYINLTPYQLAIPQNVSWNRAFESLSGEGIFRRELKQGMFKVYAAFDASRFDLNQEDINSDRPARVDLKDNNFYLNSSYSGIFGNNWQLFSGLSYGYGETKTAINNNLINKTEQSSHLKGKLIKRISPGLKLSFGLDHFTLKFEENYIEEPSEFLRNGFYSNLGAVYTEASILFSKQFAVNLGLRASYNDLLEEKQIAPRFAMAYKTSQNSQFSMAYGNYSQAPSNEYLKISQNIDSEKASHYILNYQFTQNRKLLRAEVYYKKYSKLVKYTTEGIQYNSQFSNSGSGYATGLDIFWRDGKSIRNLEYWVSYSFIDSERDYRDFPHMATPGFIADHTASLVTKYWLKSLRSQVGFSYNFNSRRPFNNPNEHYFMNGKTKNFHSLNFNWAYLIGQQKILYFSVSNVLGRQNIFSYEYSNNPDTNGIFDRRAITPTADRFFFVGFFWTLSSDKNANQLENL